MTARKRKFRKLIVESLESRRVMASLPYGAEPEDTAEYMLGRVAVIPVLLESNGAIDPNTENWSGTHVNSVMNNIQTGLNWWNQLLATKSSVHSLEWIIDRTYVDSRLPTPYEPIARNSNAYSLWVSKFLADVGFSSSTNLETNMRAFNHAQRERLNTDWVFTIFVVNANNDADGSFAPGGSFSRAFAFAGGLFQVVPSTRPASTYTHETGHMFWGRDEYTGSGNFYQRRGYYNAQNTNAMDLNPTPNFVQEPSIMSAGPALQTAYDRVVTADATLAQIGWQDSDNDGIFDVLDVPLSLQGTGRLSADGNSYRFVGRAAAEALPNRNSSGLQNNITLNRIDRIEYRINGGNWTTWSTPAAYTVDLNMVIPVVGLTGTIEIRAIDADLGITSNVFRGQLGAIPDTTTVVGVQGFVWSDRNKNGQWSSDESGLATATITLVDSNGQALQLQRGLEPDTLPNGPLAVQQPGVRIDSIGNGTNGSIAVGIDPAASTGTKIFKAYSLSGSLLDSFNGDEQQLRARFDVATTFAAIDVIAIVDDTDARLEAFDLNNNLIQRVERKGLLAGQKITLEVGSSLSNIAYVIARGFDGSFIKLDNLIWGPRSTATTGSDGSYVFPYLPVGTYQIKVSGPSLGHVATAPSNGIREVVFNVNNTVTHVDFGLYKEPSPWQNQTLPENVDNMGGVDPLDVLVLINEINRGGSRPLDGSGLSSPPYVDPNGDRQLDPLDVLRVINYINGQGAANSGGTPGGGGSGGSSSGSGSGSGGGGGGGGEGESLNAGLGVSFSSFVFDDLDRGAGTRILSQSDTLLRRGSKGPDVCGCPACSAFSCVSQEPSPSLLDIATVANKPFGPQEKQQVLGEPSILSLEEWESLFAVESDVDPAD